MFYATGAYLVVNHDPTKGEVGDQDVAKGIPVRHKFESLDEWSSFFEVQIGKVAIHPGVVDDADPVSITRHGDKILLDNDIGSNADLYHSHL